MLAATVPMSPAKSARHRSEGWSQSSIQLPVPVATSLGVSAEQHRLLGIDLAEHEGEVILVPEHILICI